MNAARCHHLWETAASVISTVAPITATTAKTRWVNPEIGSRRRSPVLFVGVTPGPKCASTTTHCTAAPGRRASPAVSPCGPILARAEATMMVRLLPVLVLATSAFLAFAGVALGGPAPRPPVPSELVQATLAKLIATHGESQAGRARRG